MCGEISLYCKCSQEAKIHTKYLTYWQNERYVRVFWNVENLKNPYGRADYYSIRSDKEKKKLELQYMKATQ